MLDSWICTKLRGEACPSIGGTKWYETGLHAKPAIRLRRGRMRARSENPQIRLAVECREEALLRKLDL